MAIVYKVAPLTYWIGKRLLKIKMIGLVNIIAGENFIPELIQEDASPEKIAGTILDLFKSPDRIRDMKHKLGLIRSKLTDRKASDRAADAILRLLSQ
jgi:lipid-A-disaccharide synthase